MIELSGGVVDIGREMLFHADGRAAATDVAGEGEEFFDRDHFTTFVAGDFGGLFQIDLVGAGNDTDEVAAFVAVEDKRLEYLRDILASLVGNVCRAQIVFIYFIRNQLVSHFGFVQQACYVCFVNFHRY